MGINKLNSLQASLEAYWPHYVREHSHPLTRWLHFAGTNNLLGWFALATWRRDPKLIVVGIATSYGFAWVGHFFVEHNIPATFYHPIEANLCELIMYVKIWQGTMDAEVEKYVDSASASS